MLDRLLSWVERWKQENAKEADRRGFEFGISTICSSADPRLVSQQMRNKAALSHDPFDNGVERACDVADKLYPPTLDGTSTERVIVAYRTDKTDSGEIVTINFDVGGRREKVRLLRVVSDGGKEASFHVL